MMMPLPNPDTVAIHPVRFLVEKASKRGLILKFHISKNRDYSFNIDAYINLFLIARYALTIIISNIFNPETVAIHPVRVLIEKAF